MFISFKTGILGGVSYFDFQLLFYQKFPGKEIECEKIYVHSCGNSALVLALCCNFKRLKVSDTEICMKKNTSIETKCNSK